MRQEDVAEALGLNRSLKALVSRIEHGGIRSSTLLTVADYLRSVRAGFRDLKPVLDRYTSVPIPEPARKHAEAAPGPRTTASSRVAAALTWTGPQPSPPPAAVDERTALDLLRIRRRAGCWVVRGGLEVFMHNALTVVGVPGAHWLRRRMATYGRKVFSMLFFTRGRKEPTRPERFERLAKAANKLQLKRELAEFMESAVRRVFEEMERDRELDWLPDPHEAIEIMALKPGRRVVTDAQLCRAEWRETWGRYATAVAEIDRRSHEEAERLLAWCRDQRVLLHYRVAVNWAARIGADTTADTPQRAQWVKAFTEWKFSPALDRALLDRLLKTVLEVWDAARPSLPPAPGPMP